MRVKHDWLQIGMTKSVRTELETKWVVGKNVNHQQYNNDKDGSGIRIPVGREDNAIGWGGVLSGQRWTE